MSDTTGINISSTFIFHAVCKRCGKGPELCSYYGSYVCNDVDDYRNYSETLKNWYGKSFTSNFNWFIGTSYYVPSNMNPFIFRMHGKSYNPKKHRITDLDFRNGRDITEYIMCPCKATQWYFKDESAKRRPEIVNRRGKYSGPKKMLY